MITCYPETAYWPVRWEGKPSASLAVRLADACARYEAHFGRPPTAMRAPLMTAPPEGCLLRWDSLRTVPPGELWPGGEVLP